MPQELTQQELLQQGLVRPELLRWRTTPQGGMARLHPPQPWQGMRGRSAIQSGSAGVRALGAYSPVLVDRPQPRHGDFQRVAVRVPEIQAGAAVTLRTDAAFQRDAQGGQMPPPVFQRRKRDSKA